jgi:TolB-like protein/Tfp pilus assembly protein PilF
VASIIPVYEYDIFISYRQKDNKYDGWVTEFVNNLKGELESTFKEEISVYFDANPHDGILETHDVDASLKDKLKCLILIPIISRTYCDSKSFAWEHEFRAFIDQASKDQFGLKVKLSNGNVASRVLPIQIHDLFPEDKAIIEKELGGVLRAVEFIYKEPGVNRPLTPGDDKEINLNKTKYRNQINKVAIAIEEVIHSLSSIHQSEDRIIQFDQMPGKAIKELNRDIKSIRNTKRWIISGLLFIICLAGAFGILKVIGRTKRAKDIANLEKSIAVLPFINDSPDKENEYIWNGMMDEVLSKLQKVKDFRVLSRTSTTQFNKPERPTVSDIAKKLGVNYIIEGSGQKYGNKIRLIVQLIGANGKEDHLWAHSYVMELKDATELFNLQSLIAQSIVNELKVVITHEEKQIIGRVPTTSLKAYDYFLRGQEEISKYGTGSINKESIEKAKSLYKRALEHDSTFARGYVGMAKVFWKKAQYKENADNRNQFLDSMLFLANKALSFDDKTEEAFLVRAGYYAERHNNLSKAIEELDEALKINPNLWEAYHEKAKYYWWQNDLDKEIDNRFNASLLNHGAELPELLTSLGDAFVRAGFPDKAGDYYLEALNLDGDSIKYLSLLVRKELYLGEIEKSKEFLDKISIRDSDYSNESIFFNLNANYVSYYLKAHQLEKALKYINKLTYSEHISQHLKNLTLNQVAFIYWVNAYLKFPEDAYSAMLDSRYKLITKSDFFSYISEDEYALACLYSIRGDKEKAIKFLDGHNQHTSRFDLSWVNVLQNDPSLDNIRNVPEFQKIIKDVESKYQAEHEQVRKWLGEQSDNIAP